MELFLEKDFLQLSMILITEQEEELLTVSKKRIHLHSAE
jgi:hypothetical protein